MVLIRQAHVQEIGGSIPPPVIKIETFKYLFKLCLYMKERKVEIKICVNDKITKFKQYIKVTKIGNGGHIVLPKELVGKIVYVEFENIIKK